MWKTSLTTKISQICIFKLHNQVLVGIGESLLTSLHFCSLPYDLPNRSSGRIYELNEKVERAD